MSGDKLIVIVGLIFMIGCGRQPDKANAGTQTAKQQTKPMITFVELGSVNCIPCKAMVPVMQAVEHKYGKQLQVVFHDVKKEPRYGEQYGIRLIPTQIFLNREGQEIFRHEGFFAEDSIVAFLQSQGLTADL